MEILTIPGFWWIITGFVIATAALAFWVRRREPGMQREVVQPGDVLEAARDEGDEGRQR